MKSSPNVTWSAGVIHDIHAVIGVVQVGGNANIESQHRKKVIIRELLEYIEFARHRVCDA